MSAEDNYQASYGAWLQSVDPSTTCAYFAGEDGIIVACVPVKAELSETLKSMRRFVKAVDPQGACEDMLVLARVFAFGADHRDVVPDDYVEILKTAEGIRFPELYLVLEADGWEYTTSEPTHPGRHRLVQDDGNSEPEDELAGDA